MTGAGFHAPAALQAAGITYRQLDYWARTGLVVPTLQPSAGSGTQRLYSAQDVALLVVVKRLLDRGFTLQAVRELVDVAEVNARLQGIGADIANWKAAG